MGKKIKTIIVIFMVFIMAFNVSFPILSYAADINLEEDFEDADNTWTDVGGTILDGIIGILTWIPRAICAVITLTFQTILTQMCGFSEAGATLTAEDIIFTGSNQRNQQVNILNINFFDFKGSGANESMVKQFRTGVATWYFALRNLAIVVSLAVLIYIGIRMAISSIASEKAMYKKMLVDWIVGFTILFFMHYIIVLVIVLNNQLVDLIHSFANANTGVMSNYSTELFKEIFSISFVQGWGSLIVYIMLIGVTLALFVMYMKRLLTLGFLIVISPLITITYSIDKLGDGKSQALDTWMKEFLYNVLIQPFHCIIYMVFVASAISVLDTSPSLANMIFAIIAILFIFKAEDIVKKIFGFERASTMEGMVAAGAMIGNGVSRLANGRSNKNNKKLSDSNKKKPTIDRKPIPPLEGKGGSNDKSKPIKKGVSGVLSGAKSGTGKAIDKGKEVAVSSTNGGQSQATSKQNNGYTNKDNRSAFSRAMSDYIGDKKDNFREFKADFQSDPKGYLKKGLKQMTIRQLAATAKFMPKLATGAMVAGATGSASAGVITGYSTPGGRFTRKIATYADEDINNLKMDKEAKKLASAYENYRIANSNLSDNELYNKSADLLEANISKLTDKNEIDLAKQLQKMEGKLEANGISDANVKVMDMIEDVQMGNIKNSISVSLDSISNSTKKLKSSNPSMQNDKIIDASKEFIKDIDNSRERGEKFINSDKYKALGKEEKQLAKEIYKSKEVLAAIGDTSKDTINEEIEKSVRKGLKEN